MKMFLIILIVSTSISFSRTPEEREVWFAERWAVVEEAKENPSSEFIEKLGNIVGPNGQHIDQKGPRIQELFREAQATLLSIPGHSEYYANRLNEIYEEALAQAKQYNWPHLSVGHERGFCFEKMSYLPSPETVRVLGEILGDMRSLDLSGSQPKDWTFDK